MDAVEGDAMVVCLNFPIHTGVFLNAGGDRSGYVVNGHMDHLDSFLEASGKW